jgi:inner membrane protein
MSPITHLLVGWSFGSLAPVESRDRTLIAVAAIAADADGFGIVAEWATRESETPLLWWSEYHHVLAHNLTFGVILAALGAFLARRKILTAAMILLSFHIHLLGDLVGARGPEGYQWPIPYFYPFSREVNLTWEGQWSLNAWPNFAITAAAIVIVFTMGWRKGATPLEMVSPRANRALVEAIRRRVGSPEGRRAATGEGERGV